MILNARQQAFIDAYIKNRADSNVRNVVEQSALDAGYSPKTAYVQGSRLLSNVKIWEEIKRRLDVISVKTDSEVEKIAREMATIAFSDITSLFTEDFKIKPFEELTEDQKALIAEIQFTKTGMKFKAWSKTAALDMLAKINGMYVTKHAFTDPEGKKDYGEMTRNELIDAIALILESKAKK
jgi:phage terminase small subunit